MMAGKELEKLVYSDNPWELLRDYDSEIRLIALDILLEKGEI